MTTATPDYQDWTTTDTGEQILQSSAQHTIETMVDLLGLQPGHRILEIGTGSGYSTALLASHTGPTGKVTSIDINADLVDRANRRLTADGYRWAEAHAANGLMGWPARAPYDRIIAWTTPPEVPQAWLDQAADDAVLVTPVHLAPVAHAHAVLRAEVHIGQIRRESLHPGSFIETHSAATNDPRVPTRHLDAVQWDANGSPSWISAAPLHEQHPAAQRLLAQLRALGKLEMSFPNRKHWQAAMAHVVTRWPERACAAAGPWGLGLGIASTGGVAVITTTGLLVHAGDVDVRLALVAAVENWDRAGRPGYDALRRAI
ncbi:protein-L-isoaspartate O-methyltransferase family protein [Saccharopolyspora phatthalungensis]|uniref:Protein-L-isoaspartate O-methyltransferase n=1 Tax=Saccharopolyspora phatthalungensis TaxID=664693 RepID=A0A840Q6W5_9PSEU|nr:methyltransferase domain-containing protein [Saccharopolyspora phatthalungensis]MBB5152563.1 protein-L-isoaspartate(D-aspartate) O-methyltransferase [Saccharopolyspora phatthalungensis]